MTNILFFVEAQLCTDLSYLYSSLSFEKEKRKKRESGRQKYINFDSSFITLVPFIHHWLNGPSNVVVFFLTHRLVDVMIEDEKVLQIMNSLSCRCVCVCVLLLLGESK